MYRLLFSRIQIFFEKILHAFENRVYYFYFRIILEKTMMSESDIIGIEYKNYHVEYLNKVKAVMVVRQQQRESVKILYKYILKDVILIIVKYFEYSCHSDTIISSENVGDNDLENVIMNEIMNEID